MDISGRDNAIHQYWLKQSLRHHARKVSKLINLRFVPWNPQSTSGLTPRMRSESQLHFEAQNGDLLTPVINHTKVYFISNIFPSSSFVGKMLGLKWVKNQRPGVLQWFALTTCHGAIRIMHSMKWPKCELSQKVLMIKVEIFRAKTISPKDSFSRHPVAAPQAFLSFPYFFLPWIKTLQVSYLLTFTWPWFKLNLMTSGHSGWFLMWTKDRVHDWSISGQSYGLSSPGKLRVVQFGRFSRQNEPTLRQGLARSLDWHTGHLLKSRSEYMLIPIAWIKGGQKWPLHLISLLTNILQAPLIFIHLNCPLSTFRVERD